MLEQNETINKMKTKPNQKQANKKKANNHFFLSCNAHESTSGYLLKNQSVILCH